MSPGFRLLGRKGVQQIYCDRRPSTTPLSKVAVALHSVFLLEHLFEYIFLLKEIKIHKQQFKLKHTHTHTQRKKLGQLQFNFSLGRDLGFSPSLLLLSHSTSKAHKQIQGLPGGCNRFFQKSFSFFYCRKSLQELNEAG